MATITRSNDITRHLDAILSRLGFKNHFNSNPYEIGSTVLKIQALIALDRNDIVYRIKDFRDLEIILDDKISACQEESIRFLSALKEKVHIEIQNAMAYRQ